MISRNILTLTLAQARQIALHATLLDGKTKIPKEKEGVFNVINHLGYIQIDTISVIERAHHHTLWTRCSDYKPEYIHQLQASDKKIFEYWGHAMSYLPLQDYRFYTHAFKRFKEPSDKWSRMRLEKTKTLLPKILKRVKEEGPLSSKDFENSSKKKSNGWWDWKPAKIALELLYWQGKLMVTERQNFHRLYDLTNRVLPEEIITKKPTQKEQVWFWLSRALQSYGLATISEIKKHLFQIDKKAIELEIPKLLRSGKLIQVKVENLQDTYYLLADTFENTITLKKRKKQLHILSPFDNFVIQRERIQKLFSFDYSIECYLPKKKRTFGYFVLPILYGDQFVARTDIKADRNTKSLIVHNLFFEPDIKISEILLKSLADKLIKFSTFQGCPKIVFMKTIPVIIKKQLKNHI